MKGIQITSPSFICILKDGWVYFLDDRTNKPENKTDNPETGTDFPDLETHCVDTQLDGSKSYTDCLKIRLATTHLDGVARKTNYLEIQTNCQDIQTDILHYQVDFLNGRTPVLTLKRTVKIVRYTVWNARSGQSPQHDRQSR